MFLTSGATKGNPLALYHWIKNKIRDEKMILTLIRFTLIISKFMKTVVIGIINLRVKNKIKLWQPGK